MSAPVAILGAGGFVGARLLERRILTGRPGVVPVVRGFRSVARNSQLGVTHTVADVSRLEPLRRAIAGCDAVVNLTAGDAEAIEETTRTIYAACVGERVRLLVHLSSAVVYGRAERADIADDAPPEPAHWMAYARAKAAAETFLRRMLGGPVDVVVLRPGLVWGPRSPWVYGPAADLLAGSAYLVRDGRGICNLIYVDNLLRSIDAVIARRPAAPGFYHVADDETVTWREYYAALARGLGVDMATVSSITLERYRPRLADHLDAVRESAWYRGLKDRLSDETRKNIKFWLERVVGADRPAAGCRPTPVVTRKMWSLQTTCHRLPTGKFREHFGDPTLESFPVAMEKTLAWLAFAGFGPPAAVGMTPPAAPREARVLESRASRG